MKLLILLSIPFVTAALCGVLRPVRLVRFFFTAGAFCLAAAGLFFIFGPRETPRVFAFGENLMSDPLSSLFIFLIVMLGLLSALYANGYIFKNGGRVFSPSKLRRYSMLFHIFLFTMLLTVLSNNLGIMWIAIEGTTLASAFLVNVDDKKASVEAAWKYIMICSVGIALALFGIILVYYSAVLGTVGSTSDLLNWSFLMEKSKSLNAQVMQLAFIFILVGYGTKMGLAPFHSWLPDAHSEAPSPISAVLSGVLLSCASFGIIRFHVLTQAVTGTPFSQDLLLFFGVLSVAISVPFIIQQNDYKRLFAYSSVEHMGLVAVGLGFGGTLGIFGALLHVINHAFNKALLFFASGSLLKTYHTKEISKIRGIARTSPFLGIVFFCAVLAIGGLPPFSVFISEFTILSGGFLAKKFLVCGILLICLVFIFAGLLKQGSRMTFGEPAENMPCYKNSWMSTVLLIGILIIVTMGVYIPGPLNRLIQEASLVVQGAQ